jgi:fructokinase
VQLGENGHVNFTIVRPAAYDDVELGAAQLDNIRAWRPAWFYFGSLFAARDGGHTALRQLLDGIPGACRFYDVNLRAGFDAPDLVGELLRQASVVKVNEDEVRTVHQFAGLPDDVEGFCRNGARRYGWRAVCVTMGERGCVLLAGGEYATAPGCKVDVVDPVGAGDAFAAAFLHGLENGWRAARIASFANRLGALVAGRPGAIPEWDPAELAQ